jgi:hypothetical protein
MNFYLQIKIHKAIYAEQKIVFKNFFFVFKLLRRSNISVKKRIDNELTNSVGVQLCNN